MIYYYKGREVPMTDEKIITTDAPPKEEKLTKEELFKKEPENFIHKHDIQLGVIMEDDKRRVWIGTPDPFDLKGCAGMMDREVDNWMNMMAMKRVEDNKIAQDIKGQIGKQGFRQFIKGKR